MVVLWAGYPFSKDYNKPRGHFYALTDVRETLRTGAPKTAEDGPLPMAPEQCWSCKGPDVARVIDEKGEDGYFKGHVGKKADPRSSTPSRLRRLPRHRLERVQGRETRPAPLPSLCRPGHDRYRQAVQGAGRFDQQSQVCGQCHVEYYFSGPTKAVKFPWDKGF